MGHRRVADVEVSKLLSSASVTDEKYSCQWQEGLRNISNTQHNSLDCFEPPATKLKNWWFFIETKRR
jgi:hypothetical protein